jgi:CRP/FNR family transcriptional regulator
MVKLKNISFFKNFSDDDIQIIKDNSTLIDYKAGDIIYYEQDEPRYLYLLVDGKVNVYKTNSKGKQLHIHTVNSVDFLGELAVFYDIPYPITAECTSKCKVLKIDYRNLDKDLYNDLFFCKELVNSLYKRIVALMQVVDSSFLTTKERVARFILRHLDDFKGATYTDISKRLNMTPETLSRVLNDFKRKKIIDIDDMHNITVIDKNVLIKISE